MKTISASRLPMVAACPGSTSLPWRETSGEWAARGTAIHLFAARALNGERDEALAEVDRSIRVVCENLDIEQMALLVGGEPKPEVAFAWHPETDTAVELGGMLERDYSKAPAGSIPGTTDLVSVTANHVNVLDFKTGRNVEHPSRNLQLRFQALAAARTYGKDNAFAHVVLIDEEGETYPMSAEFDAMDLDGIAGELRAVLARADESDELSAGPHCKYCPAFSHCDEQARVASALLESADREQPLTPESALLAWERLQAVESACKKVRESIKGHVLRTPLALPDGKQLQIVMQQQESVIPKVALATLAEHFGEEAARAASNATKTSIAKAVGKDRKEEAFEQIRQAGGLVPRTVEKLEAKRPKPQTEAA